MQESMHDQSLMAMYNAYDLNISRARLLSDEQSMVGLRLASENPIIIHHIDLELFEFGGK
jgi:hypothetical protein